MTVIPNSMEARDARYLLHPYMDARRQEREGGLLIERGEGIYVFDADGKQYIEGLAGLWCVALGFSESRLIEAATQQLNKLPYYHIFGNKTHRPGIELSELLVELAANRAGHVFYTNSGSEANDTVFKLVWYRSNAVGKPAKKKIISRQRAYHGITIASGSATGLPVNHGDFDLPVSRFLHTSCPHYWRFKQEGESERAYSQRLGRELEDLILREDPHTVAAFIGEPIMGAGGVIVPPDGYWEEIQKVCRKYDVLLIADEVITGFGRSGSMFASHKYGIDPDIMVVSKQLTSSYQPLAAVLISDEFYQDIADNTAKIGTLGHGFTGSGHPVATAVALENVKLIQERDLVGRVRELEPIFQSAANKFLNHPLVGQVRGVGLIAGIELVPDKTSVRPFDTVGKVGAQVAAQCQANGLIIRAIGDTIAFCPPLIITEPQIEDMFDRFGRALGATYDWYCSVAH